MSLFLRVRGFYFLNKQEKNYHKIAWVAEIAASQIVADRKGNAFIVEKIEKNCYAFYYYNRQYSYSPTVLGRAGLGHECEAHAGNFSIRGQTNMRKLRLGLPNLRKIFNIVKFWKAYTLERDHYFKQQRKICSLLLRKTGILIIIILMRRVLKVSEFIIEN